ncbi:MAG: DUF2235 domain-containing protein [Rhodobacteraceae bacterium]|nr:DUF2235 domain-containing protein [Paracoccaceae bacterium]
MSARPRTTRTKPPAPAEPATPEPRNLVILLDGTGNELGRNLSNVLKLYRIAQKNDRQLCYYNPGVGTISRENRWARFTQKANGVLGLATGKGLDDNVLGAYRFLVANWQEGDRIFLFGFSRGAWTARVLAGLLHLIGLVRPEQLNMCDSALGTYKRAAWDDDLPLAWHFSRVIGARRPIVHFLGVWDTVASVLVPRPDRFWIPSLETLPYTNTNPSVAIFRHALALDERRRMFRVAPWTTPQTHRANPFNKSTEGPQDIRQVWFAGVHSDIGGGYPEAESALSKIPLAWLIEEAEAAGLRTSKSMIRHLVHGEARAGSEHVYERPDPLGKLHVSLRGFWHLLEYLPKQVKYRETRQGSFLGLYLPLAEPRRLPPDATVHPSVAERMAGDPAYRPKNLPAT